MQSWATGRRPSSTLTIPGPAGMRYTAEAEPTLHVQVPRPVELRQLGRAQDIVHELIRLVSACRARYSLMMTTATTARNPATTQSVMTVPRPRAERRLSPRPPAG
jgi:hypothetical protein